MTQGPLLRSESEANFAWMLGGLMMTMLGGPLLAEFGMDDTVIGRLLISMTFSLTMVLGIWSLVESRRLFRFGLCLVAISWATGSIQLATDTHLWLQVLGWCSTIAFCMMSLAFAFRHLFDGGINANRLTGAVCVYLLLGISLGLVNIIIFHIRPESFTGMESSADHRKIFDLVYYSFVTMTTLGYGDITPVSPLAKAIAYISAVAGQFYVAILVSGLVGMYITYGRTNN